MYWIANSRFRQFDYEQWIRYFQHNYRRKLELDFSTEPELTDKERIQRTFLSGSREKIYHGGKPAFCLSGTVYEIS